MSEPLLIEAQFDDRQAVAGLDRLDRGIAKVTKSGEKLSSGLSRVDQAMEQLAHNSTAAIDSLASKTMADLDRIEAAWKQNTTAAKATAQASDAAAASVKKAGAQSRSTADQLQHLYSTGQQVAGMFGVTLGAGAVLQFIKSTADAASQIVDLSNQLEVSIDYAQRLKSASDQTGTSIDTFGRAMFTLNTNLAEGGRQVDQALDRISLTRKQLASLSQEQQIDLVIRRLASLTDVQARNRSGNDLLGMSYRQLAKNIKEMPSLIDHAAVASEAAVLRVDAASKRLSGLLSVLGSMSIEGLDVATTTQQYGLTLLNGLRQSLQSKPLPQYGPAMVPGVTAKAEDYSAVIAKADAAVRRLTASQRADIDAGLAIGVTMADLAKQYDLSAEAAARYGVVSADIRREHDQAADKAKHFGDMIREATDAKVRADIEAFRNPVLTLARALATADGAAQSFFDTIQTRPGTTETIGFLPGVSLDKTERLFSAVQQFYRDLPPAVNQTEHWSDALSDAAGQFQRLAQISDGAMSSIVRDIGSGISIVAQLDETFRKLNSTATKSFRDILAGAASVITAPVSIANMLSEPGNRFTRMVENRDFLTDQVNTQFGNMDVLRARLESLGDAGAHLWQQLTAPNHVVGETQRFLDAINREFEKITALQDIIRQANFEADQAGRTGIDAVLASLDHQKDEELRALQQLSGIDAALYQQAVDAVTRKYTALADRAIKDEADRMASETQSQVDQLTRISGLLDGIKRHTDTEIAGLGAFSSAGSFYQAVVARIQGRQNASDLAQLKRASDLVAPAGAPANNLVSLGGISIDQLVVQASGDDPLLAQRIGNALLDDVRRKGHRIS